MSLETSDAVKIRVIAILGRDCSSLSEKLDDILHLGEPGAARGDVFDHSKQGFDFCDFLKVFFLNFSLHFDRSFFCRFDRFVDKGLFVFAWVLAVLLTVLFVTFKSVFAVNRPELRCLERVLCVLSLRGLLTCVVVAQTPSLADYASLNVLDHETTVGRCDATLFFGD